MQMMIEEESLSFVKAKRSSGQKFEPKKTENYSPHFEIREKTYGLADPKIIPLNKKNLTEIMVGLFSLKEIKEIEEIKRRREEAEKKTRNNRGGKHAKPEWKISDRFYINHINQPKG